jgi:hypothetical protein
MTIQEMHYSFKLKTDKVDSLNVDSFNDAEIDWILNYAIDVFVKQRYGVTNNKQTGLEVTQKRIDDLKSLHKKEHEILTSQVKPNLYSANLSQIVNPSSQIITDDYWFTTRLRVDIKKGTCVKNIGVKLVQTDDLNEALSYKFYKPDFNWGRVLATINLDWNEQDDSIYLYTDGFEVLKVFIDYVKRPNKVWLGTYTTLKGDLVPMVNTPIDCDLSDSTHEEITTLAASLALGLISDPTFMQLKGQYIEGE